MAIFRANEGYIDNLSATTLTSGGININQLTFNDSSTGIMTFTGLSIASSTTFNVAPIVGRIVNNLTNPLSPTIIDVNYGGASNITATFITAATTTFLMLTSAMTITQQVTKPTSLQRRQNIYLGQLGHANKTSLIQVFNEPDVSLNPLSQLRDVFNPIHLINENIVNSADGANLTFNTSSGILYGLGIGYVPNVGTPNSLIVSGQSPTSFAYRTQSGGTGTTITSVDPTRYDLNGVATVMPGGGGTATNQRIFMTQTGVIRIQYGQTIYSSVSNAIAGVESESFIKFSNFNDNAILIGILSLRKDTTDLSDTTKAKFSVVSKFGEAFGATGGISTTTLQQAYNNAITPEILTDSVLGAVSIKRGSAADTDNVFEVLNGAGGITSYITGNGVLSATTYQITGTSSNILFNKTNTIGENTSSRFKWDNGNFGLLISSSGITTGTSYQLQSPVFVQVNDNDFYHYNMQNLSTGGSASSEYVLTTDDGDRDNKFCAFGINGSGFNDVSYSLKTPRSGYILMNGGDFFLGTQTAHDIVFHTSGTTTLRESQRIKPSGNIIVGGNSGTTETGVDLQVIGNIDVNRLSRKDSYFSVRASNATRVSVGTTSSGFGTGSNTTDATGAYTNFATAVGAGNFAGLESTAFTEMAIDLLPVFNFTIKTAAVILAQRLWCGLFSATLTNADDQTGAYVAMRYSTVAGDTTFQAIVDDGTNRTISAVTGTVSASTRYDGEIRVNASNIMFRINNGAWTTITTNRPVSATKLGWAVEMTNTSAVAESFNFSKINCTHT